MTRATALPRRGCRLLAMLAALAAASIATAAEPLAERLAEHRSVARLLQDAYVFVAEGSGVLIDPDGWILSNHHVTGRASEHRVRLASGRSFSAVVVGTDPIGDISLLRITDPPAEPLPYVELGTAADLVPGTTVLAIGNPFALGGSDDTPTVTRGILGSGRIVRGVYTDAIQLDAPVNPGNSGGPALDLDGRLLGINGQVRTRTGMRINSGVGLAIACTQLAAFLPHLRETPSGYVHHTAMPEGLRLAQREDGRVRIAAWEPEDPAARDLVRVDDTLVAVAGRPAIAPDTAEGLFASLPWTGPDTGVPVRLRAPDGAERSVVLPAGRTEIPGRAWHGITVARGTGDGLRITAIDPGSPADAAGLEPGWVLLRAGEAPLQRRLDWLKALAPLGIGDRLTLTVRDADETLHERALHLIPTP